MNTYKVLQHDFKELKAVKAGFAWLAIPFITCLPIFPVWFLFRGLWKIFIAYILIILILASIDYELYGYLGFFNFSTADGLQIIIIIAEAVILMLPAFKGNEWTVSNLIDQGYKISYSVQASSKKEALQLAKNKNIG
ncbi:hypothetical protein OAV14_00605 [Candidatus Pseudothioglobus singularis]|jgi:hypothetical protein|nr:hypothetical protein [Candidatus Pseudothioglobus singularis]MDA8854761.1 hypothetical protein [Candidatus Pseudothioglobus singularis]MDC0596205.1 hypothetical protein [Candidatus Pseudothioglobus singularis]MDC3280596.1 hypothetical protein [Candidatus Pseudothioglobus singularis]